MNHSLTSLSHTVTITNIHTHNFSCNTYIHHNGDYSGKVIIAREEEFHIDFEILRQVVNHYEARKAISKIEDRDGLSVELISQLEDLNETDTDFLENLYRLML